MEVVILKANCSYGTTQELTGGKPDGLVAALQNNAWLHGWLFVCHSESKVKDPVSLPSKVGIRYCSHILQSNWLDGVVWPVLWDQLYLPYFLVSVFHWVILEAEVSANKSSSWNLFGHMTTRTEGKLAGHWATMGSGTFTLVLSYLIFPNLILSCLISFCLFLSHVILSNLTLSFPVASYLV